MWEVCHATPPTTPPLPLKVDHPILSSDKTQPQAAEQDTRKAKLRADLALSKKPYQQSRREWKKEARSTRFALQKAPRSYCYHSSDVHFLPLASRLATHEVALLSSISLLTAEHLAPRASPVDRGGQFRDKPAISGTSFRPYLNPLQHCYEFVGSDCRKQCASVYIIIEEQCRTLSDRIRCRLRKAPDLTTNLLCRLLIRLRFFSPNLHILLSTRRFLALRQAPSRPLDQAP